MPIRFYNRLLTVVLVVIIVIFSACSTPVTENKLTYLEKDLNEFLLKKPSNKEIQRYIDEKMGSITAEEIKKLTFDKRFESENIQADVDFLFLMNKKLLDKNIGLKVNDVAYKSDDTYGACPQPQEDMKCSAFYADDTALAYSWQKSPTLVHDEDELKLNFQAPFSADNVVLGPFIIDAQALQNKGFTEAQKWDVSSDTLKLLEKNKRYLIWVLLKNEKAALYPYNKLVWVIEKS